MFVVHVWLLPNFWHSYHNDTKVKWCDCESLTYYLCGSLTPCEELLHNFGVCYWLIDHGMMIYGGQFLWGKSSGWDKACSNLLDAMAAYVIAHWPYQIHLCKWFICNFVFLGLLTLDQSYHRALPLNMQVWWCLICQCWLELYQPVLVWVAQPQL